MIERLQRAMLHIDELPAIVQAEIAEHIEEMLMPPEPLAMPQDFAGIWSDLQDDDEFAAIEQMRHDASASE